MKVNDKSIALKICSLKTLFVILIMCIITSIMGCANSMNSDARRDNQHWLALLEKNEINKVTFIGVESPEKYNTIREVNVSDKFILRRLSKLIKGRKLIYRDSRYMKGHLLVCDIILYNEFGECYRLLLNKNIYNKGLIETFRNDSIYQNNKFVYFVDSVFRARIN